MKTFLIALTASAWLFALKGCGQPTPCTKPAKQISKMTDGTQYGHCYDKDYKW